MRIQDLAFPASGVVTHRTAVPEKPFGQYLTEAIGAVNETLLEFDHQSELLAAGQIQDLHQVTIAATRADIALGLTIAIRNKVLEAYQEISRMQV